MQTNSGRRVLRTVHAVIGGQLDDDLVILVAEADALHVRAIVIPHLAQLQLHAHLRSIKKGGSETTSSLPVCNLERPQDEEGCWCTANSLTEHA